MNWNSIAQVIQERATTVGLQILGALVLYIVGRWLIDTVFHVLLPYGMRGQQNGANLDRDFAKSFGETLELDYPIISRKGCGQVFRDLAA